MANCEVLEKKLEHELETIEAKLASGAEMTDKDLERIDLLTHALKSLMCWKDMKEDETEYEEGMSGRHGRAANGRYVSRASNRSYADGYSRGYSEAMSRHFPPDYTNPDWMYR